MEQEDKAKDILDLLQDCVEALVDEPDSLHIETSGTSDHLLLTCKGPRDQCAQIIGKNGKTYHALEQLAKCLAGKHHFGIDIKIKPDESSSERGGSNRRSSVRRERTTD